MREHIVILSGSGISAESGLSTFRDKGGLWEQYSVYELATPEAFEADPERVLRFYNERRRQMRQARPNPAHRAIASLEAAHRVTVITQNVDDLHERAGSTQVLHLHGELDKARSSVDERLVYPLHGRDIALGDRCEKGSQLRPHVVWFGEPVPLIAQAVEQVAQADRLLVVGTSLQVYPAASLLDYAGPDTPITLVDPAAQAPFGNVEIIREKAGTGVPAWVRRLG